MTKRDRRKKPFDVGDKVVTEYNPDDSKIIRTITGISKSRIPSSGWWASADGGEPCRTCGRELVERIEEIDSAWFELSDG